MIPTIKNILLFNKNISDNIIIPTEYTVDEYTKLLMHFNGENNGVIFTDETGKTSTISRQGNVCTKIGIKKFGSASGYFDGSGDNLFLSDSDDWDFGIGSFTIDVWVYLLDYSDARFIIGHYQDANNRWRLVSNLNDGKINFLATYSGTVVADYQSTVSIPLNEWAHIAVVRNGTGNDCLKIYLSGVDVTPVSPTVNLGSSSMVNINGSLCIGKHGELSYYWKGYMDELRVSKGIARWIKPFTFAA